MLGKNASEEVGLKLSNKEILLQPGDVIYSSKSLSTFLVGHCGIVGHDNRIYHSHPKGAFADTVKQYKSRHPHGGRVTLLRPLRGGEKSASWAQDNIQHVTSYSFHPHLSNKQKNYCSKFVWQAYWFSLEEDITGRDLTNKRRWWIRTPLIRYSPGFSEIGVWEIADL